MRYLKKYNESVDSDELISDLKDILLDLTDIGFYTTVESKIAGLKSFGDTFLITVCISRLRSQKGFVRNEEEYTYLKDTLNRIIQFAKVKYLKVDTSWLDRVKTSDIVTFNRYMDDNRFTMNIPMYPVQRRVTRLHTFGGKPTGIWPSNT